MSRPGATLIDSLLKSAVTCLLRTCPDKVTVEDVARHAGIPEDVARTIFPDDRALCEALGTYGMLQLSDYMSRQIIAAGPDDRDKLIAMGIAFVTWGMDNPDLHRLISTSSFHPVGASETVLRYDASFRDLVARFMGEQERDRSLRQLMARSLIFGLADLALDDHFDIWAPQDGDRNTVIGDCVTRFVDMLMDKDDGEPAQA